MLIAVRKLFVSAQKGSFESHLMWTMVTSSAHYFILQCFIFHLQCFLFNHLSLGYEVVVML